MKKNSFILTSAIAKNAEYNIVELETILKIQGYPLEADAHLKQIYKEVTENELELSLAIQKVYKLGIINGKRQDRIRRHKHV